MLHYQGMHMEQSYVTGLPHLLFGSLHWPVSKGAISVGSVASVARRPARKMRWEYRVRARV